MTNESGIYPVDIKVLVKMPEVEKKTEGGIIIPEDAREKKKYDQREGILVAVSPDAFEDWLDPPRVGDHVLYDRYSGSTVEGDDGALYRLINDVEIGAIRR